MIDYSIAPEIHPIEIPEIPALEISPLAGGGQLFSVQQGTEPVVSLQVLFPRPPEAPPLVALPDMAMAMLQAGTKNKTADALQDAIALYGASFHTDGGIHFCSVSIQSLDRFMPPLLDLLEEVLDQSQFPEGEWQIQQARSIERIRINEEKTAYLASREFRARMFGQHIYGQTPRTEDIESLNSQALSRFYYADISPKAPLVFLAGRYDPALLDRLSETLKGRTEKTTQVSAPEMIRFHGERITVPKEGARQVSLRVGRRLFGPTHPDYRMTALAITALGGYFGSRLMKNIREEKGLTYGISAQMMNMRNDGALLIGTDVNRDNYELALDEINRELDRMCHEPLPADELEVVKNYVLGAFANSLGTPFATMELYKNHILNGQPVDEYLRMVEQVRKATAEDLLEMANKYLQPHDMIAIAGGA